MTKRGRPSFKETDRWILVLMAFAWEAGSTRKSVRELSFVFEKKIPGGGTPNSRAKRLERQFHDLIRSGVAMPISLYLLRRYEPSSLSPYKRRQHFKFLNNKEKIAFEESEMEGLSQRINMAPSEIIAGASEGLLILHEWFPEEFPIE